MKYESREVSKPQQLKHDDIVMMLMGATGTGKSHIIDTLTGQTGRLSGISLECFTKYVTGYRILNHPKYGDSLVCVDTPGFDDTHLSDMEILEMISEWLLYMHRRDIPLAGIFYLHRITDNRMGGTPLRNLQIFNELCGDAARSAVLITTMWDKLPSHTEGERREESLKKNYWHAMIQHGAFVDRFENTFKSAWDVIGTMVVRARENEGRIPLLLQEEMIRHKKRLEETRAARAMYRCLQDHLSKRQEAVQLLTDASKYQRDDNINSQLSDLHSDIEKILREVDRLHIPFTRRLFHFILDRYQMRPMRMPLASATLSSSSGIVSGFSNVYNTNSTRAVGYTVQPQEGGNPRLPAGSRESWIYLQGVDVFSASENGAATEQAKNSNLAPINREVESERPPPAEHASDETKTLEKSQPRVDFVAPPRPTEPIAEKNSRLQNEREHSLSDADEYWEDEPPRRTGRTQRALSGKRRTRSRSRRARSMSPRRNPISQLEEIMSCLPKIENVQGGLHLNFALCSATHAHGGYQAATPAVPQIGNVTFVNSNNTCTCGQNRCQD